MAAAYTEQARQKEKLEEALQNVRKGEFSTYDLSFQLSTCPFFPDSLTTNVPLGSVPADFALQR